MTEHKVYLSINSAQSVRLEKGTTEFKIFFKQMPVTFKIYADFKCNLESVEHYEGSYSKKYQDHNPRSFAYKIVCFDDKFSKPLFLEANMLLLNLLKQFLSPMNTVKR